MSPFKAVAGGVLSVVVLVLLVMSAVVIEQTERGVVTRFGAVVGVKDPGFHFVNPFTTTIHKTDVSVQALPLTELAYSRDGQIVTVNYIINYQVNSSMVEPLFREVRRDHEARYVIPRARETLKEVLANYTAQGLIESRSILPGEVQASMSGDLSERGIEINSVVIENLDFDDAYESAIQNKQVQEQQALAQVNITKQEEERKKQAILQAEAVAEKTRLEVQALNEGSNEIVEKIRAEAQLEAAKRWNGVMPTNMYANAPLPFISLPQ